MSWWRRIALVAITGLALLSAATWTVAAEPSGGSPTPTTNPLATVLPPATTSPPTTPTTAAPDSSSAPPSSVPVDGAVPGAGDAGAQNGSDNQVVPPEAAAFLASLPRSGANDNHVLVAGEHALLAAGYEPDLAARLAYGRFPVAGPAQWVDDWLEPRFTDDQFRYHLGLDLVAAFGTPLRSPVDGTVDIYDDQVGGLAVLVRDANGTVYELAHMSEIAPGIARGSTVSAGDVVGKVGSSGNATTPHCHFGVWVNGVSPTAPKPIVDQWVSDAAGRLASILQSPATSSARPLLATALVRDAIAPTRQSDSALDPARTELLYATSANPTLGALLLAEASAARLGHEVDWTAREQQAAQVREQWRRGRQSAWQLIEWLTPAPLRRVLAPAASAATAGSSASP